MNKFFALSGFIFAIRLRLKSGLFNPVLRAFFAALYSQDNRQN